MSDYQISEEDIETVVQIMKAVHPDQPQKAEPAYCLALLEFIQSKVRQDIRDTALNDPDKFEEWADKFEAFQDQ
jgi:hypothetical protein